MSWFKLWKEVNDFIRKEGDLFLRNHMLELKRLVDKERFKELENGRCPNCKVKSEGGRHCSNCGQKVRNI